mmetsp:Transcript_28570/g.33883  ORF Transcript_28570/g.33883 Transcript_28570/m.33883 type:complete len:231 (+) Transcript_28570:160-852(+)
MASVVTSSRRNLRTQKMSSNSTMPQTIATTETQQSHITGIHPIHPRSPRKVQSSHHHHQECDMYINPKSLASRLITPLPTLLIDFVVNGSIGRGMIHGTHHCPSQNFGDAEIRSTMEAAKLRRRACNSGISNPRCFVVLYDRGGDEESWVAACRLRREVMRMGEGDEIVVKVLKGGGDSWIRAYGWDRRLVDGFERKYLAGPGPMAVLEESCGTIDAVERDHLRYQYTCW